jgi:hypothetical protein
MCHDFGWGDLKLMPPHEQRAGTRTPEQREYLPQAHRGNNGLIADLLGLNERQAFPQIGRQWWQRIIGRGCEDRTAAS